MKSEMWPNPEEDGGGHTAVPDVPVDVSHPMGHKNTGGAGLLWDFSTIQVPAFWRHRT